MSYSVYQIHLTKVDADYLNSVGWDVAYETNPRVAAYMDKDRRPQKAFDSGYYTLVADIVAEDLEDVFHVGNVGPENKIVRRGERMHSVSVGDVILTPDNRYFAVAPEGFTEVFK